MGRLASKAFWALADQALFSTANFVQNLVLARWLSPTEYGVFSVLFAALLLVGVLHTALLTEPMMVYGSGRFRERLAGYFGPLMRWHGLFSLVIALAGAGVGLLLTLAGEGDLAPGVLALAIAQGPILFLWLVRRACYVKMELFQAALASLLYAVVMLLSLILAFRLELLSATSALASMAIASLITGLWLGRVLRRSWGRGEERIVKGQELAGADSSANGAGSLVNWGDSSVTQEAPVSLVAGRLHRQYGYWAVLTGIAVWIPENATHLLFPAIGQIELSAALRAVWNLVLPITHVNTALGQILLPLFVRKRGQADFHRTVLLALLLLGGISLLYAALLALVGGPVIELVYGGKYSAYTNLLWLAALMPLSSAIKAVFSQALRALEQPQTVLWAYLPSILVTFTVGFGLTLTSGVMGSLVGKVVASGVTGVALAVLFYRKGKVEQQEGVEAACMGRGEGGAQA